MIKKRLSTTVVIRDELAVQSFGFKSYLPIGKPENVVENLSWWGSDEILIFDIKSKYNQLLEPKEFDREPWLQKLAMCHWTLEESKQGEIWNHMRKWADKNNIPAPI